MKTWMAETTSSLETVPHRKERVCGECDHVMLQAKRRAMKYRGTSQVFRPPVAGEPSDTMMLVGTFDRSGNFHPW